VAKELLAAVDWGPASAAAGTATLIRQLDRDLETRPGLSLADLTVLAQLALAGGELRMTELPTGSDLAVGHDPPGRPAR